MTILNTSRNILSCLVSSALHYMLRIHTHLKGPSVLESRIIRINTKVIIVISMVVVLHSSRVMVLTFHPKGQVQFSHFISTSPEFIDGTAWSMFHYSNNLRVKTSGTTNKPYPYLWQKVQR